MTPCEGTAPQAPARNSCAEEIGRGKGGFSLEALKMGGGLGCSEYVFCRNPAGLDRAR
jgi:hypothetical protein